MDDAPYTIQDAAGDGLTLREASDMLGISYAAARGRARRAGVKLVQESFPNARDAVQDMRPTEAVEYLLSIVEELTGYAPDQEREFGMTPMEYALLSVLRTRPGRVVTKEHLWSHLYHAMHTDERPEIRVLSVHVCKLRKKLPASVGTIRTAWGQGWMFVPGDAS